MKARLFSLESSQQQEEQQDSILQPHVTVQCLLGKPPVQVPL